MADKNVSVKTSLKALKALKEMSKSTRRFQWAILEDALLAYQQSLKEAK